MSTPSTASKTTKTTTAEPAAKPATTAKRTPPTPPKPGPAPQPAPAAAIDIVGWQKSVDGKRIPPLDVLYELAQADGPMTSDGNMGRGMTLTSMVKRGIATYGPAQGTVKTYLLTDAGKVLAMLLWPVKVETKPARTRKPAASKATTASAAEATL